jgi:hypothetical protein
MGGAHKEKIMGPKLFFFFADITHKINNFDGSVDLIGGNLWA